MSLPKSYAHKQYSSAARRLLPDIIKNYFESNFPRLFGPQIRDIIAKQLLELIERYCPEATALKPGQCIWSAVAIETKSGSVNERFMPVVITLVSEDDIKRRAAGESLHSITQDAIARMLSEAHQQGALLSMRDLAVLTWHAPAYMTVNRQHWEKAHNRILPHPGSLQDMGSCISHKVAIVGKTVYEKKDPRLVARETCHSQKAVDRYLRDYNRVNTCYKQNASVDFICQVTGMSTSLVRQYIALIEANEDTGHDKGECDTVHTAGMEDRATLGSDLSAKPACGTRGAV